MDYLLNLSPCLSSAWPPYKEADSHLHTLDLSVSCPIAPPPPALNIPEDFT